MAARVSYCLVVVLLAGLHAAYCELEPAAIPLWPCYSVHRLPSAAEPFEFRYIGATNCDCVFTFEGPPGSTLRVDVHDVLLEAATSPYGTWYADCSGGAVRVFDLETSGALVLTNTVCSSIQSSPPINTSTNMAVVTSTVTRGQFFLRITVQPSPATNFTELVTPPQTTTTRRPTPARLQQTTSSTTEAIEVQDLTQDVDNAEVAAAVEDDDTQQEDESTDVPTTEGTPPEEDVQKNLV